MDERQRLHSSNLELQCCNTKELVRLHYEFRIFYGCYWAYDRRSKGGSNYKGQDADSSASKDRIADLLLGLARSISNSSASSFPTSYPYMI